MTRYQIRLRSGLRTSPRHFDPTIVNRGYDIPSGFKLDSRYAHQIQTQVQKERGVAAAGLILIAVFVLLIGAAIGLAVWTASSKTEQIIQYTPEAAEPDDPLTAGKSTKEIYRDVAILEASMKRQSEYQVAADKVLQDRPQAGSTDPTASTVEQARLSQLQTLFISEAGRRIDNLTGAQKLLPKVTDSQRPVIEQLINKEITDLNANKARIAATANATALASEQQVMNQEYNAYLLALAQLNLLIWADDQSLVNDKVNIIGGKFQERIDEAGSSGKPTATSQTLINGYQANKVTAKDLTAKVIRVLPTIKPGEHNSNRSVLKTYYDQLNTAHNEHIKALASAKKLAAEVQQFDAGNAAN